MMVTREIVSPKDLERFMKTMGWDGRRAAMALGVQYDTFRRWAAGDKPPVLPGMLWRFMDLLKRLSEDGALDSNGDYDPPMPDRPYDD